MVRRTKTLHMNERNRTAKPERQMVAAEAFEKPVEDLVAHAREYARERPEVVALWCLGLGFILGWKLKPW